MFSISMSLYSSLHLLDLLRGKVFSLNLSVVIWKRSTSDSKVLLTHVHTLHYKSASVKYKKKEKLIEYIFFFVYSLFSFAVCDNEDDDDGVKGIQ